MTQARCSPLEYDGQRMHIDCFDDLWRTPGFKYEYANGKADISIQESAAPVVCARPSMIAGAVTDSSAPEDIDLQMAEAASLRELKALWLDAFIRTPDYYGYGVEDLERSALKTLNPLFEGESPDLHSASVIAEWKEEPVGMLLINESRPRPLIEAIGVRPDVQYRGVGSAMVERTALRLQEGGENVLCSGYLLANAKSASWHAAVGFVEIPDWLTTQHRFHCAQHNLRQGLVRDVSGMKQYVDMLRTKVENMRQDRDEDRDAHCPFKWIRSDGNRIDEYLVDHVDEPQRQ